MAKRVIYTYVSDLSGEDLGEDAQTLKFGFLGVDYEVDVSQAEADEFAGVMEPYIKAARRVGGRRQSSNGASSRSGSGELAKVREWARQNGYTVSSRGRIAKDVVDAYNAAN